MDNILNRKELISIKNCPLFKNVSMQQLKENISNMAWLKKKYSEKSILLDFEQDFKGIGILLSGEITVNIFYENGNQLPLRCIHPSEVFGLSYFLANNNHQTLTFITNTPCSILIINEACLMTLLNNSSIILENYLNYMNNRIKFLISRIVFFNLSNNQQKICHFLLNECNKASSQDCYLNMPKTTICEYLGIGRTSFYRVLNSLAKSSAIKIRDKDVITIYPEKLINILNSKYN